MYKVSLCQCVIGAALLVVGYQAKAESCHKSNNGMTIEDSVHRIAKIRINPGNLFDPKNPKQRRRVHRVANKLHLRTLSGTVKAALPFRVGDAYSSALLAEGERALRRKRYIRDATITAKKLCGHRVIVDVRTVDNWTLTPSLNFGRAGGDNTYTIELQDLNFLGTGKELKLVDRRSGDLRKSTFIYGDDNVFGGRHRIRLELGDNDDGELFAIQTGLPFYSEKSTNSWWLDANSESLSYNPGDLSERVVPVLSDFVDIRYNRRSLHKAETSFIWGAGLRYARQITQLGLTGINVSSPNDFHEIYPFLEARWVQNKWIKKQNYENIRANEDINLGFSFRSEVGFIVKGIGDNQTNKLRLHAGITKGWQLSEFAFHKIDAEYTPYLNDLDRKYGLSARYQYFRWLSQKNQLNIKFTAERVNRYSPVLNRTVGGENGLKAYPNKYQQGNNRVIGLLEYRHVTNWSPYSLVNTAFTIFAESGRAWSVRDESNTLANVGIGLLLSPTRSSTAAVNRLEIAVPLVHGEGVGNFQLFIGTKVNY